MKKYRGITRVVFVGKKYAFKLPQLNAHGKGLRGVLYSFSRGFLANMSEAEWSSYEDYKGKITPVLWSYFGIINVYPRAEQCTRELELQEYYDIGFVGSMDKKPANVGYLNGRLVWLDYDQSWNDQPPCRHIVPNDPSEE